MAYTAQEMAVLAAGFAALPNDVKALLTAKSTAETQEAVATLTVEMRGSSMSQALASVVSVQCSNRAVLRQLAAVADGATIQESAKAFKAALASDADSLTPAVAVALAALKHYGL